MANNLPSKFHKVPEEILQAFRENYKSSNPTWEGLRIVLEDMMEDLIRESESDSWLQWPGYKEKRVRLEGERRRLRKIINLLPTESKFKE